MDSFYVPYVGGGNNLFDAISRMAAIKSPALVVNNNNIHYLFTSKTVFENYSRRKDMDTCAALPASEGYTIMDLSSFSFDPSTFFVNKPPGYYLWNLFEDILTYSNFEYGFLFPEWLPQLPQLVQVITLREEYKDKVVGTNTICVCNSTDRHLSYDPGKDGEDCDIDPPHVYKCTSSK